MTMIRMRIRRRPVLWFVLLTFVPTWGYELAYILVLRLPLLPWMFAAPFIRSGRRRIRGDRGPPTAHRAPNQ
jgi:hypothetical protein